MKKTPKTVKARFVSGWFVRDAVGKMRRAIFFCEKELVPADDRHEVVRCEVSYKITPIKKQRRGK